jgi:hypothetical protein
MWGVPGPNGAQLLVDRTYLTTHRHRTPSGVGRDDRRGHRATATSARRSRTRRYLERVSGQGLGTPSIGVTSRMAIQPTRPLGGMLSGTCSAVVDARAGIGAVDPLGTPEFAEGGRNLLGLLRPRRALQSVVWSYIFSDGLSLALIGSSVIRALTSITSAGSRRLSPVWPTLRRSARPLRGFSAREKGRLSSSTLTGISLRSSARAVASRFGWSGARAVSAVLGRGRCARSVGRDGCGSTSWRDVGPVGSVMAFDTSRSGCARLIGRC